MRVAIVGATGLVGLELLSLIKTGVFPYSRLDLFATQKNMVGDMVVHPLSFPEPYDLVFFCTPAEVSKRVIPLWIPHCGLIIDLSSAFRSTAPLVIPEINPHHFKPPLIASPNCTTTIMLMALAPLHRHWPISTIVASTYQAASGGGHALLKTLIEQEPPLYNNLYLHESVSEEEKMVQETRQILDHPTIEVWPTCVRVPVPRVHSLSLHVSFSVAVKDPERVLAKAPGICLDQTATALRVSGKEAVYIGRLRQLTTNTLQLWVLGDQLLKGAALNALQIAEFALSGSRGA